MDFSRLHIYTPPQYVPENTGYTYALSSSYSTEAVDFETKHKLPPVYDSPRMSRRRLRPVNAEYYSPDRVHNDSLCGNHSYAGNVLSMSNKESSSRSSKQKHRSVSKPSVAASHHTPRKISSDLSLTGQSSILSYTSDSSILSTVLDESSIQERTELGNFWGLDDDDDTKGGNASSNWANGDVVMAEKQMAMINGYTCSDCSILSERNDVLTAYSTSHAASSMVYSRNRNKKDKLRGIQLFTNQKFKLAKYAVTTTLAWFLQLYQTILMKTGFYSKAHSSYCGRMNVKELITGDGHLNINGESLCDDCKGMKHDTHRSIELQSTKCTKFTRITRTVWLIFAYAGKAASAAFWWLGTGWYQLITLMSLLDVFLLTRCLPKFLRWLLLLIPFLLLFGLWYFGLAGLWAFLPIFNGTAVQTTQSSKEILPNIQTNEEASTSIPFPLSTGHSWDWHRVAELEKQIAALNDRCVQSTQTSDDRYSHFASLLQKLKDQVKIMSDKETILVLIRNAISQHVQLLREEMKREGTDVKESKFVALHQKLESRIAELEFLLQSLSSKSEEVHKEVVTAKNSLVNGQSKEQYHHLVSELKRLDLELSTVKSELSNMHDLKASCAKMDTIQGNVDAQVRELVNLLVFGSHQETSPESFKDWLSSQFVSQTDFQSLLKSLEVKILKNLTQYWVETKKMPDAETATCAVNNAGIGGISEQQVHMIVKNALKLYSEDQTGMVDFALESGGGSILSTRCSETYETKTALMSLFGIPLWYFSQSPRVVIQPDVYPGNCWAFKGSQGYLVIRLSVKVHPVAFTLEHIPKSLSPTGNISSSPKQFSVYGLDDEYEEEGTLLGKYMYDKDETAIQTFFVTEEILGSFQIIELRVLSNWGHPEYTCLYRFRVHGDPVKE
ncbi:SUN domain-containing protein 1 isoform X2 [Callorhinchus milii]|uniref:Sad1 and UNC84 domain containing 1 n=2 Tax=Callorhinchus milii TaxID=7868 RepID=A0A4W3H7Y2_CALMI|nr:SUN domain-containing protein 1 isoform X2 [Callorhinchus milii]|eukprot:gi/632952233/ref/XP_007891739.1/ PREDICTED: SUN domain-containing protein 1 isoform X2 [Callorhinchus milii]